MSKAISWVERIKDKVKCIIMILNGSRQPLVNWVHPTTCLPTCTANPAQLVCIWQCQSYRLFWALITLDNILNSFSMPSPQFVFHNKILEILRMKSCIILTRFLSIYNVIVNCNKYLKVSLNTLPGFTKLKVIYIKDN